VHVLRVRHSSFHTVAWVVALLRVRTPALRLRSPKSALLHSGGKILKFSTTICGRFTSGLPYSGSFGSLIGSGSKSTRTTALVETSPCNLIIQRHPAGRIDILGFERYRLRTNPDKSFHCFKMVNRVLSSTRSDNRSNRVCRSGQRVALNIRLQAKFRQGRRAR